MYVVDASVAVKWLVPEEGRPEAKAVLDHGEPLLAPDLISVEVCAAVARKARLGQIPRDSADAVVQTWLKMLRRGLMVLHDSEELLEEALRCSVALDHALPDCLYLALSRQCGALLVTADARLAGKAAQWKGARARLLGKA